MNLDEAIKVAIERKLSDEPVSWVELADKCEVHPEKLRARVRRKLERMRVEDSTSTKVLLFDIETSPMVTYSWSNSPKFLPEHMIIKDWYVINWAAKWLFDDKMMTGVVTPEESIQRDDERIVKDLWKLLDEADIVIAHFGDAFDIKMMNGRFLKHGLNMPMSYNSIDTKKVSSRKMRLPSHSLNYVSRYLGLEQKNPTDFSLWERCMAGESSALKEMDDYCQQDVKVLEDVYLKLRPFIQPHPQMGFNIEADAKICPTCGHDDLEKQGVYQTTVNQYDGFRCKKCGSITRSRKALPRSEHITSSVPR